MNDGQLRGLVGLSAVLLVLVGLLQYWEPSDDAADPEATALVWEVDADAVQRVTLTQAAGEIVLERGLDGWQLLSPIAYPADAFKVESLLDELARIEKGVPVPALKAESVELAPQPRARVRLEDAAGAVHELEFGIDAPVGFRTYARRPGGEIVAVEGNLNKRLAEGADAYRDRKMLRFRQQDLSRVVLSSREGTLDLREVQGAWWLEGYARVDLNKLDDFFHDLRNLRFDEIVEAEATGILEPAFSLELHANDGTVQRAQFGDDTPMGTVAHVLGVAAGMTNTQALRPLSRGPQDLGAKHAFPLDPAGLERVEVSFEGQGWVLERGAGDTWTRAGSAEPAAEGALRRLGSASIHYRRDAPPEPVEPWGEVQLQLKSGPRRFVIGQREGAQWRTMREVGGGSPYLVPVSELEALRDAFLPSAAPVTPTSGG